MRTLFVTDPPAVVDDWLGRRRALGQDRFDEVWEGEHHVAPAPSGRHAKIDDRLGRILVGEILSPGDESRVKLGFYFRVGAEEVLLVDPEAHAVEWLVRAEEAFVPADGSTLLGITSEELAAAIDWT